MGQVRGTERVLVPFPTQPQPVLPLPPQTLPLVLPRFVPHRATEVRTWSRVPRGASDPRFPWAVSPPSGHLPEHRPCLEAPSRRLMLEPFLLPLLRSENTVRSSRRPLGFTGMSVCVLVVAHVANSIVNSRVAGKVFYSFVTFLKTPTRSGPAHSDWVV